MAEALFAALPADVAILVAAVADWRVAALGHQAQERRRPARDCNSIPTRDILAELAASDQRPRLLIGFAAETDEWSPMQSPSAPPSMPTGSSPTTCRGDVMGGARNRVHLVTADGRRGLARSQQG